MVAAGFTEPDVTNTLPSLTKRGTFECLLWRVASV